MPSDSKKIIKKFCELCIWINQSYQIRKYLFDENPNVDYFKQPHYQYFFGSLCSILNEYWIHQLAKLHDPAADRRGNKNLSLNYMIECGDWDQKTKKKLEKLNNKMLSLAKPMIHARHKILSHNDLDAILKSKTLGKFRKGTDIKYFSYLKEFASLAQGTLFVYDDNIQNDVEFFTAAFNKGRIT